MSDFNKLISLLTYQGGTVQRSWEGWDPTNYRLSPGHGIDVQYVQISQPTTTHTSIYNEFWAVAISVVSDSSVRFSRRWRLSVCYWNIPVLLLPGGGYVEYVQVIQISWYIIFRVITIIGQSAKEENTIPVNCEAVSEARAWRWTVVWSSSFEPSPLPPASLKLIQFIRVFSIFYHASKHQDSGSIHNETISCTSWWNVSFHRRYKPLVGSWK